MNFLPFLTAFVGVLLFTKTLENIKKGTFVVEYVGEVITSETAEERGQKYGTNLFLNLSILSK